MSKAKPKTPKHDVFNRKAQPFHMLGKEFKYEFIPSGHFQGILLDLLAAVLAMDKVVAEALKKLSESEDPEKGAEEAKKITEEGEKKFNADVAELARRLLETRLYEILTDVLQYQNDHEFISPETLMKKTSALEMARFSKLVMQDEEIFEAFQEYVSSLGKLRSQIPTLE